MLSLIINRPLTVWSDWLKLGFISVFGEGDLVLRVHADKGAYMIAIPVKQ